jgi:hypothetical protein
MKDLNESKFFAFWNGNRYEIEAKDLWDAKQKAIIQYKVPKSKVGLLAVVSAKSQENQDFKFEALDIPKFEEFVKINEDEEVSVDKALSPKEKKALKDAMENVYLGVDSISFKRDGSIVAKRGYFYSRGQSPDSVARDLEKGLKTAGIEITIIDKRDDFKPWPKDSHFVITFKLKKIANESVVNESNDAKGLFVIWEEKGKFLHIEAEDVPQFKKGKDVPAIDGEGNEFIVNNREVSIY